MNFLKKSLIRKFVFFTLIVALLVVALGYYFFRSGDDLISYKFLIAGLGVFLLAFVVFYFLDVVRPLKSVLYQMQALLSGKPYKRIYTKRLDEVGILAYFFNQVTKSLGEVSYDIKDRKRMISELSIASQLQRDILPVGEGMNIKGMQLVAKTRPATELGGDSFNYLTIKGKTYIYVGDVTGHGVAAGLIMTMVNSFISVFADIYGSAYEILVNVNKYIKKHVKKAMFMTLVMLCWDQEKEKLTYVGAGHEHILIYRAATGQCDAILSGGVALGMVPDNSKVIQEKELAVNDGDVVVLYTDGVTEARNVAGELFGLERLKNLVIEYAAQYSADGVHYHIAKSVSEYMEGHGQDDDVTLIVMKRDKTL